MHRPPAYLTTGRCLVLENLRYKPTLPLETDTYDHRYWRTRDPVRSPIDKPVTARLVIGSVTTSESLVLYVFFPPPFPFSFFLFSPFIRFSERDPGYLIVQPQSRKSSPSSCLVTPGDFDHGCVKVCSATELGSSEPRLL